MCIHTHIFFSSSSNHISFFPLLYYIILFKMRLIFFVYAVHVVKLYVQCALWYIDVTRISVNYIFISHHTYSRSNVLRCKILIIQSAYIENIMKYVNEMCLFLNNLLFVFILLCTCDRMMCIASGIRGIPDGDDTYIYSGRFKRRKA